MAYKYITLTDLSETIRKNLWKVPRDIDFIIGIPRSGMIVASVIASYLNVPLIDINGFVEGVKPYGGNRLKYYNNKNFNRCLVVDDTVYTGKSINEAKTKLKNISNMEFIYMCAYLEGYAQNTINFYLEDIRQYAVNKHTIALYEWNIFQHSAEIMTKCLYDIDGVLCVEPPDERNENTYINYIKNAIPLFIPKSTIGGIITYRLEKNKEITENWLNKQNIKYNKLIMFPANSWDERNNSVINSSKYKGDFYKTHNEYNLFIESDDNQAKEIAFISNKQVYSVEKNKMYN